MGYSRALLRATDANLGPIGAVTRANKMADEARVSAARPAGGRPRTIHQHVRLSYLTSRLGLAIAAIVLPFFLWGIGDLWYNLDLQNTMSAYYHAPGRGDRTMRNWFVGGLWMLGAIMYVYKGFSRRENLVLNAAAIFAVCVAMFPMEWNCEPGCSKYSIHGASAILAFVCIAYVAVFRSLDTLSLLPNQTHRLIYQHIYQATAVLMIVLPLLTWRAIVASGREQGVFGLEAAGLVAFAVFWIVKTIEIKESCADDEAMRGDTILGAKPATKPAALTSAPGGAE